MSVRMLWCSLTLLLACLVSLPSSQAASNSTNCNCSDADMAVLARQIMLEHLLLEERIRSEGGSGIKQKRVLKVGERPYNSATHVGGSTAAFHDHANYKCTLGLGEVAALLNGVNFRTRHNDYKLVKPIKKKGYHQTEEIKFPPVPKSVKNAGSIEDATKEMQRYFEQFLEQKPSKQTVNHRNFKPILCYLEGHWMIPTDTIEDPFKSPRHKLEASSWDDLHDKIRFAANSGKKSNGENFSHLPRTFITIENGKPVIAQWTYRILCHELKTPVPLWRFQLIDDLTARMNYRLSMEKHLKRRTARFQLNPQLDFSNNKTRRYCRTFLDELMEEIPGVDNYNGNLNDTASGLVTYDVRDNDTSTDWKVKNTAFYHRCYETKKKGAGGNTVQHKSFNDDNIFFAQTSDPRVAPICAWYKGRDELTGQKINEYQCQRWTYAIPLEIIFLTPLTEWNPYNLKYKGEVFGTDKTEESWYVTEGGKRTGDEKNEKKAYNGTNGRVYYQTPTAFFDGSGVKDEDKSKADTSNKNVGVLNENGDLKIVGPSGIRIMFDFGTPTGVAKRFRQRWPIYPIQDESSQVGKMVAALQDVVLQYDPKAPEFAAPYNKTEL